MPMVSEQVPDNRTLAASLLEANQQSIVAQQEWESEWNQAGLASRLSPKVIKHLSTKWH